MCETVAVRVEAEGADDFFDVVGRIRDSADSGVELKLLGYGEEVGSVELGAYAQGGASGGTLREDGGRVDEDGGRRGRRGDVTSDERDSGA